MFLSLFGIIGIVVILITCKGLYEKSTSIEDWALAVAVSLVLLKCWPLWLVFYLIKSHQLEKNNK
jgi:hypothetical protein